MKRYTVIDAIKEFVKMADSEVIYGTIRLMQDSKARWVADPEVQGTFGFVMQDERGRITTRAIVLVYSPELPWMQNPDRWDFEVADDFYQYVEGSLQV